MKRSQLAGWSATTSLCFLVLLILLHFIKPEIEPVWNFISEYEVGRFGWLMQLAFLFLSVSCILLVFVMWTQLRWLGKIGLIMLMIAALGMLIAAIFITDPLNTSPDRISRAGELHQLGAMLDQIPFAALFITIAIFAKKEWQLNKLLLIIALIGVWFGFIYFVGSVKVQFPADGKFGPNVRVGWQNRLMIVTQALWLVIVALQCRRNLMPAPNFSKI